MGVGAAFSLLGAGLALTTTPSLPACPPAHPCHHVLHVGPVGSPTARVAWDSEELFRPGPIAIGVNYSPKLATDAALRTEPLSDCAVHYVLPARFTGFATRCGRGRRALHLQFANVTLKHLRIGVTYWTPTPRFTG